MKRGIIRFDDWSGNLVSGKVWQMDFPGIFCDLDEKVYGTLASSEGVARSRTLRECPLDSRHITSIKEVVVAIDLFSDNLGDFVPCDEYSGIISASFANRLQKSSLTGYQIRSIVEIAYNQSQLRTDPKLSYLDFQGRGGRSNRLVIEGAPNLCPHCGKTSMVCLACGHTNWPTCIECEKW